MSVARITEISAESPESFEAAVKEGIRRASASLRNVSGVWIKDQNVVVENGTPAMYKVHMKVTFVLDD
jgi:hypothetical protein